jgi:cytochrome P450
LTNYFKAGYDANPDVSGLTRERAILHRKYGFTATEQGSFELSIPWVGTTNAIPALYWMLLYVASEPQLLEDIRSEVANVITTTGKGADQTLTFNITRFNSDCPLLLSMYQETNRLTNFQVSVRMIEADTILSAGNETILVKKGNVVQIPAGVMHTSTATWGPNSDMFDGRRFMKQVQEGKEQGKAKRSAYIPFGGGKHLCPGRHFAQAEILGMVAAVVTGFEILSKDGGPVTEPNMSQASKGYGQSTGKPKGPAEKLGIKLIRREGMEHAKFGFSVQD